MDYKQNIVNLRKLYIEAEIEQRLNIIFQRIELAKECGPDIIVTYVSAVEGFARSLIMHQKANSKEELSKIYHDYKYESPVPLIEEYLRTKELPEPESFFGDKIWENFRYAIEYRHILVHECTYLGQDKFLDLADACHEVLSRMIAAEGLTQRGIAS